MKSKKLKIVLSFFMLLVVCFVATPKVYFHKLLGHTHIKDIHNNNEGNLEVKEEKNTQDCDLDKFETPVYFTIFKFILNYNPFKSSKKVSDNYKHKNPSGKNIRYTQLRAPPKV